VARRNVAVPPANWIIAPRPLAGKARVNQ